MILTICLLAGGCVTQPANPTFPVTLSAAQSDLGRMCADPWPLQRPLVIVSGFMDPGIAMESMENQFRAVSGDSRIVAVCFFECMSFEQCRRKVMAAVDQAFPDNDPAQTTAVDVVGYSMGGLVARLAADPPPGVRRRLRICRLFTIDSPNRGAVRAAELPILHPLQCGMRPDSALVARLNAKRPPYPVYAYVRLGDTVIGLKNASVAGNALWWLPTPPLSNPHLGAFCDDRILADIARRLRGEIPLATLPPARLPVEIKAVHS